MSFPELDSTTAHKRLADFRIVDVRQEHEFHGPLGRIQSAELVPLSTVAESAAMFSATTPLLLVCRSGQRSGKACELLQGLGVETVTNLAGGMIAWNQAGLPVKRTEPKTLDELVAGIVSWLGQVTATNPVNARARVIELLLEAGVEAADITHAAADYALDGLSDELEQAGPPADLKIAVDAFRKDLAVL